MREQSSNKTVGAASLPVGPLRRHRVCRRLPTGETISICGSWMDEVAVSFAGVIGMGGDTHPDGPARRRPARC
jgi:hypothetical protein